MSLTRKVQEGSNGQIMITIPRDLARSMELEQGMEMKFSVKDSDTLELSKKK